MPRLLVCLLAMTTAWACNKQESAMRNDKIAPGDMAIYTYAQTQCADPWATVQDDKTTAQNAKKYLEAEGVAVVSIEIKRTYDGAVCAACSCPSGKTIYVTSPGDEATRAKLRQLKFQ